MTQDEIIEMAREAGLVDKDFEPSQWCIHEYIAFAKQVAAKAIAELESQEPVGEVGWAANVPNTIREVHWKNGSPPIGTKLFTHPPQRTEQNFCSRCGKRTKDSTHIHTCTPPQD